jgi:hypothetical protein
VEINKHFTSISSFEKHSATSAVPVGSASLPSNTHFVPGFPNFPAHTCTVGNSRLPSHQSQLMFSVKQPSFKYYDFECLVSSLGYMRPSCFCMVAQGEDMIHYFIREMNHCFISFSTKSRAKIDNTQIHASHKITGTQARFRCTRDSQWETCLVVIMDCD